MYELALKLFLIVHKFFIPVAQAVTSGTQNPTSINLQDLSPLGQSSFMDVLNTVLVTAIKIAAPIASLMVIYGAFKILTAGAKPENLKEGRQIIFWAIVGFIIILVAGGITSVVTNFLGVQCSPDPAAYNYSPDCQGPHP